MTTSLIELKKEEEKLKKDLENIKKSFEDGIISEKVYEESRRKVEEKIRENKKKFLEELKKLEEAQALIILRKARRKKILSKEEYEKAKKEIVKKVKEEKPEEEAKLIIKGLEIVERGKEVLETGEIEIPIVLEEKKPGILFKIFSKRKPKKKREKRKEEKPEKPEEEEEIKLPFYTKLGIFSKFFKNKRKEKMINLQISALKKLKRIEKIQNKRKELIETAHVLRNFIEKKFDMKKKLTYEELIKQIELLEIEKNLKGELIDFFKEMITVEYSKKFDPKKYSSKLQWARRIVKRL